MGFKVKTAPGRIEVFHPAEKKRLVIKLRERVRLIPRWRVLTGLFLSSLFAGAGFGIQQPLLGFPMLLVALGCLWAGQ